jgi:hypothetical protein
VALPDPHIPVHYLLTFTEHSKIDGSHKVKDLGLDCSGAVVTYLDPIKGSVGLTTVNSL